MTTQCAATPIRDCGFYQKIFFGIWVWGWCCNSIFADLKGRDPTI